MILLNSLIISLCILGYHLVIETLVKDYFKMTIADVYDNTRSWKIYFYKPLFLCPTCMTSIWGTALYLLYYNNYDLKAFVLHIGLVAFFNYSITKYVL